MFKNIYGVIYKITNKIDGKVYIGQTKHSFDERYHYNLEKYTHNLPLKNAIKKYGINNFEINKCIDVAFSEIELDIKEECYISIYKSYKNGYNLTLGGDGIKGLAKEKHGMYGTHRTGSENPFYGHKHTERTIKHLKEVFKNRNYNGKNNPNYGNGDKIKGNKNPMFKLSPKDRMDKQTYEIWLKKIRENHYGGKNPKATKVICITTGKIFDSIVEGANFYKISASGIRQNCIHKSKHSGKLDDGTKLQWEYLKESV